VATNADIPAIVALESNPIARQFVGQWNEAAGEIEAYVILRGLSEDSRSIELKRIVVAVPERGLGRRVLTEIIRTAFRELGAHRLFLDVFEDNGRARHLYESLGFKHEGIMREAAYRDGRWFDLHLMSMLESEYD
jgi:diamine N-acetyltransferase